MGGMLHRSYADRHYWGSMSVQVGANGARLGNSALHTNLPERVIKKKGQRFEVLTAVMQETRVFWDVALCRQGEKLWKFRRVMSPSILESQSRKTCEFE